jgi:hypothetical protein
LAKYLWTEINQTILNSPGVQFSIKKLKKLQLLDYVATFNLLLQVNKLIEVIFKKGSKKETKDNSGYEETLLHDEPELETLEKKLSKIFPSFSTHPPVQRVDGKALSENEILFAEYLSLGFDERS